MDLNTGLRESLRDHADSAPNGAELLHDVRKYAKRIDRRRRAISAFSLVIAIGGTAYAMPLLLQESTGKPPFANPSPATTSLVRLVESTLEAPRFPYKPSWLPEEIGTGKVRVEGGFTWLSYEPTAGPLAIAVGGKAFPWPREGQKELEDTINGIPAKVRLSEEPGNDWKMISWPQDGRWITVQDEGGYSLAQLKRVAEGLRPGKIESTMHFKLALVPEDYVIAGMSVTGASAYLQLTPVQLNQNGYDAIAISAEPRAIFQTDRPGMTKTTIGGREAWIEPSGVLKDDKVVSIGINVYIAEGDMVISVGQGNTRWLTDDDLIRFTEGITYTK